jgi:hypothetical protein
MVLRILLDRTDYEIFLRITCETDLGVALDLQEPKVLGGNRQVGMNMSPMLEEVLIRYIFSFLEVN